MIKHIQAHVNSCSLCRREKMLGDKYQLQTTEIHKGAFAKVAIDLIMELPTSHCGNKNILVMLDHLTGWPIAKAIPDKEVTTVANATFEKCILEHGASEILLSDKIKNSQMTPWPMCVKSSKLNNILQALTHQGQMARQKTLTNL